MIDVYFGLGAIIKPTIEAVNGDLKDGIRNNGY